MPGGSKKCKGCSSAVVNPVTCLSCGINCHPGASCLARSGHPCSDKSLLDCRSGSSSSQSTVSQAITSPAQLLSAIPTATLQSLSTLPSADVIRDIVSKLIDSKLSVFQDEILSGIRADLAIMKSDITSLSERVKALEDRPAISSDQIPKSTDDFIEELKDREIRSKNLIIFGLPEPHESSPELNKSVDLTAVRGILTEICPLNNQDLVTHRLGIQGKTPCRPICARLESAADVKRILQAKHRYKGPYKISDDKTKHQRETILQLREKLRDLHVQGQTQMTIRYIRGVPKIVKGKSPKDSSQKNVN